MTKYECCYAEHKPCRCVIECSDGVAPFRCCLTGDRSCNWHKVEDQKPEWCKVGAWCYIHSGGIGTGKYQKIEAVHSGFVKTEYLVPIENISEARLRPWTYEEAPETLKVIDKHEPKRIICLFLASKNKNSVQYTTLPAWYIDTKTLMDNYMQLDGSRCGVLEHKNEQGEWVE